MKKNKYPNLRGDILALGFIQVGNYLMPMLTLPYLTRVMGPTSYGEILWVQTLMMFGSVWVDFGFSWSATREISASRHDVKRVAQIFANVWTIQWLLLVIFALILVVGLNIINKSNHDLSLYIAGFGFLVGQVMLPTWLFQGLEKLRILVGIQFLGKLLAIPIVFYFVLGPQDQVWALIFFSATSMLSGILALIWLAKIRFIPWVLPDVQGTLKVFKEGRSLFFSRALISLYTTLVPLAVGWWAGPVQLAYFNLADRLRQVVQTLVTPVTQAIFPRMSWMFVHDRESAHVLIRKSAWGIGLLSVIAGITIWLSAELWMLLFGGVGFIDGASALSWLAFVPFVVAMSNIMGVQIMLPQGLNRPFTIILGMASLISFVMLYPMIKTGGATGAAQLVLFVECLVTFAMAIYLKFIRSEKF